MSIYTGGRGRKRREIGTSGSARRSAYTRLTYECRIGRDVVDWSVRFLADPRPSRAVGVSPLSASMYLFRPLVALALVSSTALHLRHRCIPALLLCLPPAAALRDTWIVGSHLPHYHTNRPLAHSDTAFILCPSHLRLAGDQPKSDLVHDWPFERPGCRSYELAREPLAWGTRRKSIILNHGVIGSNDQTTTRRTRFTPRRFARTCHVAFVYVKKGRFCLLPSMHFPVLYPIFFYKLSIRN